MTPQSEIQRLIKYMETAEPINRMFIIEALLTILEKFKDNENNSK